MAFLFYDGAGAASRSLLLFAGYPGRGTVWTNFDHMFMLVPIMHITSAYHTHHCAYNARACYVLCDALCYVCSSCCASCYTSCVSCDAYYATHNVCTSTSCHAYVMLMFMDAHQHIMCLHYVMHDLHGCAGDGRLLL